MYKSFVVEISSNTYTLKVSKHKNSKKITLKANLKNKTPHVIIPYYVSYKVGIEFFKKNYLWFDNQIGSTKVDFNNITHISLLEVNYSIIYVKGKRNICKICENSNTIVVNYVNESNIQKILANKIKKYAYNYLVSESELCANKIGVSFNKISISDTISKWGSCSAKGNLRYNFRLIMAPTFVINYVVSHEVAHLKEFNHSEDFWNVVNSINTNIKEAKDWLKENGKSLY